MLLLLLLQQLLLLLLLLLLRLLFLVVQSTPDQQQFIYVCLSCFQGRRAQHSALCLADAQRSLCVLQPAWRPHVSDASSTATTV